jgi:hypothetical protein
MEHMERDSCVPEGERTGYNTGPRPAADQSPFIDLKFPKRGDRGLVQPVPWLVYDQGMSDINDRPAVMAVLQPVPKEAVRQAAKPRGHNNGIISCSIPNTFNKISIRGKPKLKVNDY